MPHAADPAPALQAFLSYPRERKGDAQQVYRFLRSVGVNCWWDHESLVAGDDWERERAAAQRNADIFLLICSEETFGRQGVIQREIKDAIETAKDRPLGQIHIVNLRASCVDLPPELGRYHWMDLFSSDWKSRLAGTLKKALEQRQMPIPEAVEIASATLASGRQKPVEVDEEDETGTRTAHFFQYEDSGDYWDYVNSEIVVSAMGSLLESRRQMADWLQERGKTSDWELSVSEFHRHGELVSLIVAGSSYFGGTIHPNHFVTTINIFGSTCGRVAITDLFEESPKALTILLDYCDLDLKRQGMELGEEPLSLAQYAETYGWNLFSHFNVNERGMILNFSEAAGLPHVLAIFEVYVPWEAMRSFLAASIRRFLETCGLPVGEAKLG